MIVSDHCGYVEFREKTSVDVLMDWTGDSKAIITGRWLTRDQQKDWVFSTGDTPNQIGDWRYRPYKSRKDLKKLDTANEKN